MDKNKKEESCCCPALEGLGMLIADLFGIGPLSKMNAQIAKEKEKERERYLEEMKSRQPTLGELMVGIILGVFAFVFSLWFFYATNHSRIAIFWLSLTLVMTITGIIKTIMVYLKQRAQKREKEKRRRVFEKK